MCIYHLCISTQTLITCRSLHCPYYITTEGCASWAQKRLMMPVPQPRSITALFLRETRLLRTARRYVSVRLLSDNISKWSLCEN